MLKKIRLIFSLVCWLILSIVSIKAFEASIPNNEEEKATMRDIVQQAVQNLYFGGEQPEPIENFDVEIYNYNSKDGWIRVTHSPLNRTAIVYLKDINKSEVDMNDLEFNNYEFSIFVTYILWVIMSGVVSLVIYCVTGFIFKQK